VTVVCVYVCVRVFVWGGLCKNVFCVLCHMLLHGCHLVVMCVCVRMCFASY